MGVDPSLQYDPKIAELIRIKVRRLVGDYGFNRGDEHDLRQALWVHVAGGMRRFDPARATAVTYADRIVTSKIASIVGHATAAKRDRRRQRYLGNGAELVIDGNDSRAAPPPLYFHRVCA